jgi:hypothetical protein
MSSKNKKRQVVMELPTPLVKPPTFKRGGLKDHGYLPRAERLARQGLPLETHC